MKRRVLSVLLALVMLLGLLPTTALALEEPPHSHDGWTAVTMGANQIKLGDVEQASNTLPDGDYYLDADLDVSLTVTGTVRLCLNGHSVTEDSYDAVKVEFGANLTVCDCAAESTGRIAYTGTSSSYYGIYNRGTLTLSSGAVEGAYCGVNNYSACTFTMTGGTVMATGTSGRGVYNDYNGVFRLSGGSVSGVKYGIYNDYSSSKVYLSGAPSISGGTADIYMDTSSSEIYADDGAAENPIAYSGRAISLGYSSLRTGETAVRHVTEGTKDLFALANGNNYELELVEEDNILQIQGKPQTLTWYDINGEALTGDGYPASIPYNTYFDSTDLPAAPAVDGKIFLGWLYQKSDDSDWSTKYWSGGSVYSATSFKAIYIDSFAGSGTADDPYQIAGVADLQKLATIVDNDSTACNNRDIWYKLTADIDLSTVCGEELGSWKPIGYGESGYHAFQANFDGNGKTISNLYINTSDREQGLFGGLYDATVKDLTLTGSVTAGDNSGVLAARIDESTVENVDVTGVTVTPYGYTTDENRTMAYKTESGNTVDIQGNYKNNWVKTTYGNAGYEVATANLTGATVTASPEFINGSKYIQLSYTVTAGETAVTDGKLAVHADVQIGDNDGAAVEVIQDADGQVIGLKMVDTHTGCLSQDAQFNLYFGGTGGVTPVDTYWFGFYGERNNNNGTYGKICFAPLNDDTKSSGHGTYEQVGGVYTKLTGTDSGLAVSWQNISLEAGESKTYSLVLGVGEKADPPQWSDGDAVTLTLAADATQNDRLVNVSAKVKDAAGLTDTLYYSVDGGEGETVGEVVADGSTMKTITGQLDLSGYAEGSYLFSFWVVNSKGAASTSVERTITITADGIEGLDSGDEPAHTHSWASTWSNNGTHHWHECTADGCDVTENAGKDGYGAHVYDDAQDATCNTCGYLRTVSPAYSISGTVENHANAPVEGARVKLMRGLEQIGEEFTTQANGRYTFTGVAPGSYNVVATRDGKTMTILVTVTAADLTGQNLTMPGENVNSVLNVKDTTVSAAAADVTKVVVGGLDAVAEAVKQADENSDATSVTVTMTVEAKDETNATVDEKAEIEQIKAAAPGKTLEYLAIKVEKKIDNNDSEPVTDTGDTVVEIVVPYDFSGKTNVMVYRYHDGSAEALIKAQDGSKARGTFRLDTDNGLIHIYATKFSTYAIGYTDEDPTPGRPGGSTSYYTLTATAGQGGSISPSGKISVRRNGAKTFTITPDEGYLVADVLVDGKSVGARTEYTFEKITANHTIEARFQKAGTRPAWNPFEDVKSENWFYDSVKYVYEQGLMMGTDSTHFAPDWDISRAMSVTILYRMAGEPETTAALTYPDCVSDSWYAKAVAWGTESGVINGYDTGDFGPDDPVTREQLALMLYRYAGSPAVSGTLNSFTDAGKTGAWAMDAVTWAVEQGILTGKGGGILDPEGKATRAEVAAMLARFLEHEK